RPVSTSSTIFGLRCNSVGWALQNVVLSSNHHGAGAMPTRFVRVGKIARGRVPILPHLGKRFCPPYAALPFVPAKAGTQGHEPRSLDSRFRGNERSFDMMVIECIVRRA